jgi:hypothetical protein
MSLTRLTDSSLVLVISIVTNVFLSVYPVRNSSLLTGSSLGNLLLTGRVAGMRIELLLERARGLKPRVSAPVGRSKTF